MRMGLRLMEEGRDCFGHIERIENDGIDRRVYVGECVVSRLIGAPPKRRIDSINDNLKERS